MAEEIEICHKDELPDGERKCVTAQGRPLAVFNVGGELRAIENICPHAGMPLAEGEIEGKVLTCPFHGFAFDIDTGKNVEFEDDEPVTRFPVKVRDGDEKIVVELEALPAA